MTKDWDNPRPPPTCRNVREVLHKLMRDLDWRTPMSGKPMPILTLTREDAALLTEWAPVFEAIERKAAELWRSDNLTKSVFDCDLAEKESYRLRVVQEIML